MAAPATVGGEFPCQQCHWETGKAAGNGEPQARRPAIPDIASLWDGGFRRGGKNRSGDDLTGGNPVEAAITATEFFLTMSNKTRLSAIPVQTLDATRVAPVVMALLLGAFIILGVGFAQSSTVHNAAHDGRHSLAFPCH